MPSRQEVAYFGAGPAPLPTSVVEAGAKAFVNYNDCGLGLGEISHRSPTANKILEDTKASLTTLLDIPDDYEILFMQGGGSGQFTSVVQNLVGVWVERRRQKAEAEISATENKDELVFERLQKEVQEELKLDYIVTGSWSLKAAQEATRLVGAKHVNIALDARTASNGKFGKIPAEDTWTLSPSKNSAFVYFCDNETVDGVEFPNFPKILESDDRIVVADMSSNFLSRNVDVKKYSVIFVRILPCDEVWFSSLRANGQQGGAQKNIGIAGISIVIIRKSLLPPQTPTPAPALLHRLNIGGLPGSVVLDYATIAKNNSLYNTLPIFNLWIAGQVMAELVQTYGVQKISGQEQISNRKAEILYSVLDKYPQVYHVVPDKSVRSRMNLCFRVNGGDAEKEKEFLAGAEKRLLQGLKGHRSVGGIRASNYNAVPLENVEKLAKYLEDYATGNV